MELGEKLRAARLEAGLSQRALCGDALTRNMLSQIENGAAQPSMKTLQYLAQRLGKPVSFFLEDALAVSPNQDRMRSARRCFDNGDWQGVMEALGEYQAPDEVFDRERGLLWCVSCLELAEEAIRSHREPYARELLEQSQVHVSYCGRELHRRYLLLLGQLHKEPVSDRLPSLDTELLLRAREAVEMGNLHRAQRLLDAVEDHNAAYHLLQGQVYLEQKAYREASSELLQAEDTYPKETVPQLEICFRELGDFEKAYFYACKARETLNKPSASGGKSSSASS